ncbi:MAG: hypothetical protein KC561_03595 [Myxococcales bacterium]|nr:hypothetical protein [Myxococcales bacterium]
MNAFRMTLLTAWVLLLSGCLNDPFQGSVVQMDLLADTDPSSLVRTAEGDASHYELWAGFGEQGVASLGKFTVNSNFGVFEYPSGQTRIGSVFNPSIALQDTGVRLTTELDLSTATEIFITVERNGETDYAPSSQVIMFGTLQQDGQGTLRGALSGEYTNRLGETRRPAGRVAIVIAGDHVYF